MREKGWIIYFLMNNNYLENYDKEERDNMGKILTFILFNNELHINANNALKKYLVSFDDEGKYVIFKLFHKPDYIGGKIYI